MKVNYVPEALIIVATNVLRMYILKGIIPDIIAIVVMVGCVVSIWLKDQKSKQQAASAEK